MLSKSTYKLVRSLATRKGRKAEHLFVAEGPKIVDELLPVFEPVLVVATEEWMCSHPSLRCPCETVSDKELERLSLLQSPQQVLALMKIPSYQDSFQTIAKNELSLALDGVQDPGNLGTIIRIADWFGVHHIWTSPDTCDVWNPKVIQASMGSVARVAVHAIDLQAACSALTKDVCLYGTSLSGTNIYETTLQSTGIIVMGNEGQGVSDSISQLCTKNLFIPRYPSNVVSAESLNVAMATGIILSEFRRQTNFVEGK